MYRARFETLENRTMFSANPLVDLSAVLEAQPAAEYSEADYAPMEALSLNFEKIIFEVIATETVASDEQIAIGGRKLTDIGEGLSNTLNSRENGLMALLVPAAASAPTGTVTFGLTVDPRNRDVEYFGSKGFLTSDPQGPTYLPSQVGTFTGDGSVHEIAVRPNGLIIPGPHARLSNGGDGSNVLASLVSSEEYFARFADSTLEPAALEAEDSTEGFEIQSILRKTSSTSPVVKGVTGVGAGGGPH